MVEVSDLNKSIGGSTDLVKKRHGSADLHTPIHPPWLGFHAKVCTQNIGYSVACNFNHYAINLLAKSETVLIIPPE